MKNTKLSNSRILIAFMFLSTSLLSLTACEKSRLRVRPAVASTPNTPALAPKNEPQHHDEAPQHDEPIQHPSTDIIPIENEREHAETDRDRTRQIPPVPQPPKSETLEGVPTTTVNSDKNNKNVIAHDPYKGAELECQSQHCKDEVEDEIPEDELPMPKKPKAQTEKPTDSSADVLVTAVPLKKKAKMTKLDYATTHVTVDNESVYDFKHFHLIVEVDPNSIKKISSTVEGVDRKQVVIDLVKDFVKGFNQYRTFTVPEEKDFHFTIGLVAATTHPKYSGQFLTLDEVSTKDIDELDKIILPQLQLLSGDKHLDDGNKQIPGGHPYVSLSKLIDSNPKSIDGKTDFFDSSVPTIILAIGEIKDQCGFDHAPIINDKCESKHTFQSISKRLIARKVLNPAQQGVFAPVSFKHILLNHFNEDIVSLKNIEDSKIEEYKADVHGARYSNQILVKKLVFDRPYNLLPGPVVIKYHSKVDELCAISGDTFFNSTGASKIDLYSNSEAYPENHMRGKVCDELSPDELNQRIIDTLYQNDLDILSDFTENN